VRGVAGGVVLVGALRRIANEVEALRKLVAELPKAFR